MPETKDILFHIHSQVDYTTRTVEQDGRTYIVVPVVMLVEGVHNGSAGPILHLPENYAQNAEQWNGVPLTAGHPRTDEGYVSVNQVDSNLWVVGHLYEARVEGGKLKAEAWIDQQLAIAVNPEVVNYIMEGKCLEVSTGMGTVDVPKTGQHNGEEYQAITMEYYPDHLALLPGERGACSWQDGCGIRTNKEEEPNEMSTKTEKQIMLQINSVHNGLQNNEAGFLELSEKIQGQLNRLDSDARYYFLREVYADHFIYKVQDRDQGTERYFRQSYSVQENGEVTHESDPQEVRMEVEFLPIQQNAEAVKTNGSGTCGCSMKRTKFNNNKNTEDNMSEKEKDTPSGEVMDKVVSLINNERTQFSKTDRNWLLELNEEQLDKLEPTEAPAQEVTREQALQALAADLSDVEKLTDIIHDDIKPLVENGISAYKDNRQKLIKSIQANTGDVWKAEKLEAMDTETLENLEKTSRKTDYSGNGHSVQTNAGEGEELMLPAGMKLESN